MGWLPGELPFHGTRHCVMVQKDEDPEVGTQSGRFSLHTMVLKNGCTVPYALNQIEPDCEAHPTWQVGVSGCITPGALSLIQPQEKLASLRGPGNVGGPPVLLHYDPC